MESGKSWPSGKELEVLRLLQSAGTAMYGLALAEESGGSIGRSSIYVLLGRLETKGYITVNRPTVASHPGMPRPLYKINVEGERALAAAEVMGMFGSGVRS